MGQGRSSERTQKGLEVVGVPYLIDTSALARAHRRSVDDRLTPLMLRGDVRICGVVELEMLYSARASAVRVAREEFRSLETVSMEQAHFDRAAEVLALLAARGKHRAVGVADVLIAACAEHADLTLLHYDSDFDTITSVTGQRSEWIVPRGSVP